MKNINEFINEQLITEHFVNCLNKEDMKPYADEVWKMLQKTYEYCGGMAGMDSVGQLIDETTMWKLVRKNNKIVAGIFYSNKRGGRKACYACNDGTELGVQSLKKIMVEDNLIPERQAWGEYSGKAVSAVLKTGGIPVPACIAQTMLEPKEVTPCDDGWFFVRKLDDGKTHHKLMVGNLPNGKYEDERPSEELIHILKELAKKYYAEDEKNNNK